MSGPYRWTANAGMGALNGVSGVTASLPAGAVLGMSREEDGITYRLFYNNGNSQVSVGRGVARLGSVGAYSVSVSTVSDVAAAAAAVCYHVTATTGTYFWGAVRGGPIPLAVSNVSIATGAFAAIALNGAFTLDPVLTGPVAHNLGDTTTGTGTTDAVSGRFFVLFE